MREATEGDQVSLEMDVVGLDAAVANAIRRAMLAEVRARVRLPLCCRFDGAVCGARLRCPVVRVRSLMVVFAHSYTSPPPPPPPPFRLFRVGADHGDRVGVDHRQHQRDSG